MGYEILAQESQYGMACYQVFWTSHYTGGHVVMRRVRHVRTGDSHSCTCEVQIACGMSDRKCMRCVSMVMYSVPSA